MNRYRFFSASGAAIATAMMLCACASTVDVAQNGTVDCAPMAGAAVGVQMASLRGFRDGEPQRSPVTIPAASGADQSDERICRSAPPATGSRLGPRTLCMTGDEWESKGQNDRDQLTDAEARALASTLYGSF